jgi:hypothetical protein
MRDMLAMQSVSMEIIIISMEERGCGRPKKIGKRRARSSQKVPAGRR